MSVLSEVLAANEQYAAAFGDKGELRAAARAALRDPHLHGRAARPRQVRRPQRGRRARDPQRRRPRQRRRDPLARDLLQAARHRASGSSSTTPNCGMEFFTNEVMRGLLA